MTFELPENRWERGLHFSPDFKAMPPLETRSAAPQGCAQLPGTAYNQGGISIGPETWPTPHPLFLVAGNKPVATESAKRQPPAVSDVTICAAAPAPPATGTVISAGEVQFKRHTDGVWRQVDLPVDTDGPAAAPVTITSPLAHASAAATPTWTLWDSQYEKDGSRTAMPFTQGGIAPAIIDPCSRSASITGPWNIPPPSSESSPISVASPEAEEAATNTPESMVGTSDSNDEDNSDERFYDAVEKLAVVDDKPAIVNKPAVVNKPAIVKAAFRPVIVQPAHISTSNRFAVLESLPKEDQRGTKKKRNRTRRRRGRRSIDAETVEHEVQPPHLDEETPPCVHEETQPHLAEETQPHLAEETQPHLTEETQPRLEDGQRTFDADAIEREVQRRLKEELLRRQEEVQRLMEAELQRHNEEVQRRVETVERRLEEEVKPRLKEEMQRRLEEERQRLLEEEMQSLLEMEMQRRFEQLQQQGQ